LIENVLLPHLDFTFASKKALVFEWDNLSRKQKINFITSFRIFLVRHSSVILADFLISQNKKLDEDAIEFEDKYDSKGNFARVNSKVLSNRSETYNVGFRLHCDKSAWKIYDVVINGVSIIKQYKGQFRYKIDKDGFDGLIAFLNYKNDVMLAYQLGRQ
jgi:phospholipid transport system substrate-binding protein